MSSLISIGRIGVWLAASVALTGAAPAQLPSDPPSYELRFDRPAKASKFSEVYPGLATWAYFGAEPPARAKGQAISRQLRATSRMWPGTLNVNVDPDYCPGATTPSVSEGSLFFARSSRLATSVGDITNSPTLTASWSARFLPMAETRLSRPL